MYVENFISALCCQRRCENCPLNSKVLKIGLCGDVQKHEERIIYELNNWVDKSNGVLDEKFLENLCKMHLTQEGFFQEIKYTQKVEWL